MISKNFLSQIFSVYKHNLHPTTQVTPTSPLLTSTEGVKAKVYFRGEPYTRDGRTYLKLQQLKLDFSVKDIQMGVENLQNSNAVLREYNITF